MLAALGSAEAAWSPVWSSLTRRTTSRRTRVVIIAIRKYIQGPAFKVVLWVALMSVIFFWGGPSLFRQATRRGFGGRGGHEGPAAATVNGQEIEHDQYMRALQVQQDFIHRVRLQYGQYAELLMRASGMATDPKVMAIQTLVRDKLVDQAAATMGIKLTPECIAARLEHPDVVRRQLSRIIPADIMDSSGGLNRYLQRTNISHDELNELIGVSLGRDLCLDLIGVASYVPAYAMRERFQKSESKKQYSVLTLNFDSVLAKEKEKPVSDETLKSFFKTHNRESRRYWKPEERMARTITFDAKNYGIVVGNEELEAYYEEHRDKKFMTKPVSLQVRTIVLKNDGNAEAARVAADKLRAELVAKPEIFAQKAKELSIDKESGKEGGLMPFFSWGTKNKAFEQAAFLLKNDGDISEPVVTDRGIEIIERVARKPAENKPLEVVKGEVEETIRKQKFKDQCSEALHELLAVPEEEGVSFEPKLAAFSSEHKGVAGTTTVNATEETKLAKAIFSLRGPGTPHYVFSPDGSTATVVVLTGIRGSVEEPFEAVKKRVADDYHQDRAAREFAQLLKDAAAKATSSTLEDIAKGLEGATIQKTQFVNRPGDKDFLELEKKGIPAEVFLALSRVGSVGVYNGTTTGYVVRVDAIEAFDQNSFEKEKDEIARRLDAEYFEGMIEGFVASLYRNATIKMGAPELESEPEGDYEGTDDYE